jgi:hypothetical protein
VISAVRRLDDPSESIAEICRQVGAEVARHGIPRPSYVHLRRLIKAERLRRRELEGIARDIVTDAARGLAPRVDLAVGRAREARLTAELTRKS